jgi:hypothetical protein
MGLYAEGECMVVRLPTVGVSRREVGAGAVAAVTALVGSVVYVPGSWMLNALYPAVPPTTELYFFLYTGFAFYALLVAPFVALVVGTGVWRSAMSTTSTPHRGALAGVVTALSTVLVVPVLFSLLVLLRELVRAAWWSPESYPVFASTSQSFVVVTLGGLLYWSPFVGVILVPLGALAGWVYERGR